MLFGMVKEVLLNFLLKTKNEILLSVKDHGAGIPKEDQNRIFNLFERGVSLS